MIVVLIGHLFIFNFNMMKLAIKIMLYGMLIIISLECLTRLFYLGEDKPTRYLDDNKVEKWVPNQEGFAITGNRKQNFIKYHINKSGFNSYREYNPTKEKIEVALIGDSFVEGFHQPYLSSTGRKVELLMNDKIEVFEYGYSGYDMADQLHLINSYKSDFELINRVYIKLKFSNDLRRDKYEIMHARLNMESPLNNLLKKSKLLIYLKDIGFIDPIKKFIAKVKKLKKRKPEGEIKTKDLFEQDKVFIQNFIKLVNLYGYDKTKFVLLMDVEDTSEPFLKYLNENNYQYVDFGKKINYDKKPTTLIYDMHWNNYGRGIVAKIISSDIKKNMNL